MTEREAFIALNMVQDIGAATVENGIAALGSASAFFSAGAARLAAVKGIGSNRADDFAQAFGAIDWRGEMARAAEHDVTFLTPVDDAYPALLKRIHSRRERRHGIITRQDEKLLVEAVEAPSSRGDKENKPVVRIELLVPRQVGIGCVRGAHEKRGC